MNSKDGKGAFRIRLNLFPWMPTQCDPTVTTTEAYFAPLCVFTHMLLQLKNTTPDTSCEFQ